MAAENEATLKLLLDIRDSLQKLADFENKWSGTARKTAADSEIASKGVRGLGDSFDSLRNIVTAVAGSLVAVKLAQFAKESLAAAADSEDAQARVQASIEATGGAAKRNLDQLTAFAEQIQATTTVGDEEVLELQNTLLSFTNIVGSTFDRAARDVVDLSAKTRRGVEETALAVGKALDAPAEGLAGLARIGVRFSDAQEKVIKRLVETGRVGEAQGVILAELEKRAAGAAVALNDTLGGAIRNVKDEYGELQEEFGVGLASSVITDAHDLSQTLRDLRPAAHDAGVAIGGILEVGGKLAGLWPILSGGVAIFAGNVVKNFGLGYDAIVRFAQGVGYTSARLIEFAKDNTAAGRILNLGGHLDDAAAKARTFGNDIGKNLGTITALGDALVDVGVAKIEAFVNGVDAAKEPLKGLADAGDRVGSGLAALPEKAKAGGKALADDLGGGAKKAKVDLEALAKAARDAVEQRGAAPSGARPSDIKSLEEQQAALRGTVDALKAQQQQGDLNAEQLAELTSAEDELKDVSQKLHNATLDVTRAIEAQTNAWQSAEQPIDAVADITRRYAEEGRALPPVLEECEIGLADFAERSKSLRGELDEGAFTLKNTSNAAEILAEQWLAAGKAGSGLAEQSDSAKAAIAGLAERQHEGIESSEGFATAIDKVAESVKGLQEADPVKQAEALAAAWGKVREHIAAINGSGPDGLLTMKKLVSEIAEILGDVAEAA